MSKNILDEVSKTSIQLLLNEPFYGHFFASLIREVSDKTDSLATAFAHNQMIKLLVSEAYWNETINKPELRYGEIKHQILHIVFKHMLRVHNYGNKRLYGIAADLLINQYLESQQLTNDAITLADFPDFNLKEKQNIDYYYKKLLEVLDGPEMVGGYAPDDDLEDLEISDNDDNDDDFAPGAPRSDDFSMNNPRIETPYYSSEDRLIELLEDENLQLDQHNFWEDFSKLSNSEKKVLEGYIDQALMNSYERYQRSKNTGKLPGDLEEHLKSLMESQTPQVNWKRILRLFTESSSRTYIKNTIRRPSKRYGTTPGIRVKKKQKVLVAIDTSGSVNEAQLKEFFAEIYHIWKQGAEIFVVECDTIIQNKYLYQGTTPNNVKGRGGTDFNAPLQFANTKYFPDAIIYFTDGYAAPPTVYSRKPILWVITKNGINEMSIAWHELPYRKVKMN